MTAGFKKLIVSRPFMQDQLINRIKKLTGKKYVTLVHRCNRAIFLALRIAQQAGKDTVLMPDMGGWLTFRQYSKKLGMKIVELKTECGLFDPAIVEKNASPHCVLIVHSLAAYAVPLDMIGIERVCAKKGCLLINDCSGSIGTPNCTVGDLIVCSFGKEKPVNAGYGGFIATNNQQLHAQIREEVFDDNETTNVWNHLRLLETRLTMLRKIHNRVKKDLQRFDIVHRHFPGLNVIVRFSTYDERNEILSYCQLNNLPWTECPRNIRILEPAISIEVKRLG